MPGPENIPENIQQEEDQQLVQHPEEQHDEEEDQPEEEQNQPVVNEGGNGNGGANAGENANANEGADILGNLGEEGNEDEGGENRDNVRQAVNPKVRRGFLKRKLVTEYKEKKDEKNAASLDTADIQHTGRVQGNAKADSIADYFGYGSIAGAAGSAIGAYGAAGVTLAGGALGAGMTGAAGAVMHGKEAGADAAGGVWDTSKKWADTIVNDQTSKDVFESIGIAGNVSGTIGSGIKMGSNIYRARKDKNRYKRQAAKHRATAAAFSAASEITGGLSHGANLGLFGKRATEEGTASQAKGGAFDIASGTAGLVSKIFDYTGNKAQKEGYKQTSADTNTYAEEHKASANADLTASGNVIRELKNKKATELTDDEKTRLKEAREKRHTAKAQKYAMAQASKLHKTRSEESTKGLIGLIGGGIGFLGAGLTGLSKILGNTTGLLGMAGKGLSALAGITKTIGGLKEFKDGRKEKKKLEQSKHEVVEDYLKNKVIKIKEQATQMELGEGDEAKLGAHGRTLSDDEAKRIAIMRLGVDIPDSSDNISDEAYDQAFRKLTEKRANNILKSSGNEKTNMLGALGLDNDATFEDVVAALEAS